MVLTNKPVSFEKVLGDELDAITSDREQRLQKGASPAAATADIASTLGAGGGSSTPSDAYARAREARLIGLAFSGGGIRSATFNLGVLQALARLDLLRWFDYLSTVSGGGYIGSWLAAWIGRTSLHDVQEALVHDPPPDGHAQEPHEIWFLREYSNYLTPRTGLFTADTWTAISTYLRNLLLNQTILIAALFAILLVPRLLMWPFLACVEREASSRCFWVAAVALLVAVVFIGLNLTALGNPRARRPRYTQQGVIHGVVILPIFIATWFGTSWFWSVNIAPPFAGVVMQWLTRVGISWMGLVWGVYAALLYSALWAGGWALGVALRAPTPGIKSAGREDLRIIPWITIVLSAFAAGLLGGVLLYAFMGVLASWHQQFGGAWIALAWGPPLLLMIFIVTVVLHIGLMGANFSEESREWWSRLGGWLLIYTGAWAGLFGAALYAPWGVAWLRRWTWPWVVKTVSVGWVVSTLGGLWAGRSSATGGRGSNRALELAASAAPPVFVVGLLIALSLGLQVILARMAGWTTIGWDDLYYEQWKLLWGTFRWSPPALTLPFHSSVDVGALLLCVVIVLVLSWRVDINQFSLHLLYRNRLTRCYLGASTKPRRHQNLFTGFDPNDDLLLADFGAARPHALPRGYSGPYPIINVTLNLVGGGDLAWQQRKAASFVFTPRYSGYELQAQPGYRPTGLFAKGRLSLGTAFAISGAAVSPNWGYHSSPPLAFLMTLFNVRLGWWLGNPAHARAWKRPGPWFGLYYLLKELFGSTDEKSRFLYLSDGGHFENLGIYELVRRRCRFIVACDAGQDGELTFADLGNAIRKCRDDFGVDIEINVDPIRKQADSSRSLWHCAVGTIHYENVDDGAQPGTVVYVKASLTGSEPTDVLNYASTDPAFPHQTTVDQWFDESQFESYRQLGYYIGTTTFEKAAASVRRGAGASPPANFSTEALFVALKQRWYPPSRAVERSFTKHTKTLNELMETMRSDTNNLQFLDAQIYPEWEQLMAGVVPPPPPTELWLPPKYEQRRAGFYLCASLIQLMENVYLDLDLEREHEHPDNRGWMNLFRHWSWCGMLRVTWAVTASTYGGRFQTFCERYLHLTLGEVGVQNLGGGAQIQSVLQSAHALNFVEVKRIEDFLSPPKHSFPSGLPNIVALQLEVPDPASTSVMTFTFGFALVTNGQLVYLRVQDHLRNMGLGRQALRAMRIRGIITQRSPSPDAKGLADKEAYQGLVALLDSVWHER